MFAIKLKNIKKAEFAFHPFCIFLRQALFDSFALRERLFGLPTFRELRLRRELSRTIVEAYLSCFIEIVFT